MSNTVIYYRGEEMISPEDKELIEKVWGGGDWKPYNHFQYFERYQGFDTGLHDTVELLLTVSDDKNLYRREQELEERIARTLSKGLTSSSSYYSLSVEHNMLDKLMEDARLEVNKWIDDPIKYKSLKDLYRIYGLPYKSVMEKVRKDEEVILKIEEPVKLYDIEYHDFKFDDGKPPRERPGWTDQQSSYKLYHLDLPFKASYSRIYEHDKRIIYDKFPYVGKVHYVSKTTGDYGDKYGGYWQIYVYDYAERDWAVQNVIHELYKI